VAAYQSISAWHKSHHAEPLSDRIAIGISASVRDPYLPIAYQISICGVINGDAGNFNIRVK
jgi:hypothetical protein